MSNEQNSGGNPSLHIDSDWKAQAQAEKERLAEREAARGQASQQAPQGGADGASGEMPPANFSTLMMSLGSQAMMGLGAYGDPQTGRVIIDLVGAQFAIDLLGVLEEKTKGNLTAEETAELAEVLAHLRARFVQVAQMVAAQMQQQSATGVQAAEFGGSGIAGSIGLGGAPGGPGGAGASGLIMPD